jgi:hypothetical protein
MAYDPMLRKRLPDTFAVALAVFPRIALFLGAMSSLMASTVRERLRLQAERERRAHEHAARRSWA